MVFTNVRRVAALLITLALLAGCGLTDQEKKDGADPSGRATLSTFR